MTWTQTLRERWWLAPIAILLVAAAIIIRIITNPLEVNANVNDGDQSVPRTATIDLRFNQDMKADSVQHAFSISPAVLVGFKAVSAREFQFRPKMTPSTSYNVSVRDAKNTSGRGVSNSFHFKTEPAPSVAAVKVNNEKVTDGQQGLKPTGNVQINFSQPMDGGKTPIAVNGKPFDSKKVSWSSDGKTAALDLKLGHSHPYQLSIPQAAVNRKQDPLA
ncbi:MAG TPA: Ig-like domain-containing protein, partial [Verrucomicrobiae bacterium]|nr:Ig-like domain-containing protein [Verrucomicrobiae bacterium]